MNYTQEQKQLLLDNLFDGVVYFNIFEDINIIHRNRFFSIYQLKYNKFWLSQPNIWRFFENEKRNNFYQIIELTQNILKDLTKQKNIRTENLRLKI